MAQDTRRFAETHEWAQASANIVTVGITDYAARELRDITYVELPAVGDSVAQGDPFGEIESVKTVAELLSPVDGEVAEVNDAVIDDPSVVSREPFGEGWLIKIKATDTDQLDELMTHDEYDSFIEDQAEEEEEEEEDEDFLDAEDDEEF